MPGPLALGSGTGYGGLLVGGLEGRHVHYTSQVPVFTSLPEVSEGSVLPHCCSLSGVSMWRAAWTLDPKSCARAQGLYR